MPSRGFLAACGAEGDAEIGSMLKLGWTTLETREDALRLARELVEQRLAACVQVDGPLVSIYHWEGRLQESEEHRLVIKFLPEAAVAVEAWVLNHHPYQNPEWLVIEADTVAEKYLSWARANCTSAPF